MIVYQPGTTGRRTLLAQPGITFPASHFMDAAGKPRMFAIEFKEGVADVDDQLGQYLIDEGIAKRSPLILPERFAA